MRKYLSIVLVTCLFFSCKQDSGYKIAFIVNEKDLIPEGITYSEQTNSFYLSSILKKKIIKIDVASGDYSDFNTDDLGLRMLGMIVDDKYNHLWACGNITQDNQRISALVKLNLKTGKIIKKYEFTDTIFRTFNDLVLDKLGNIYFTNESGQNIFKYDVEIDSVHVFLDHEKIESPNGITISPDNKYLYVASGNQGIRIVDIQTKQVLNAEYLDSRGLDGIKYYKNSIVGIQNYVANASDRNISRYFLSKEGNEILSSELIDIDNPYYDIPTTFTLVNNNAYCLANSQMLQLTGDYEIKDTNMLKDVIILKYKL